ncbi:cardiomyopathy-associated protein 5 [Synchiropus picturatus]
MHECENSDLQDFQGEASDTVSQDDDDEVEELQNSLREVVQDPSVRPQLQCLMVDPSFSMVTVQSEDSGIVWETASSRCSTPWASETSSVSEACSMEGAGTAGKITIVFDEEKVTRRRTRSGGRYSRLSDRFSRPGSSRSASALGVERPEMAEVSLPNVKQETATAEADLEEIKNKDQQLFSLISDGFEILNIRVPSKLPTVDEEESTDLQDNLSYLDQTPRIRSRNQRSLTPVSPTVEVEAKDGTEPPKEDFSQSWADRAHTPTQAEDYFEKFTLVDVVSPEEQAPILKQEVERPAVKPQDEHVKEATPARPAVLEDSFVVVSEGDIVEEHLDEVFYGDTAPDDATSRREEEDLEMEAMVRARRESQRSAKENGGVLFVSEETTLTPIYISSGPPKIIDPILLEEPTAMSFMYTDLYEDALGERRKSDEEFSEAESVASERTYKRRFSDSEEDDGYLQKFTLKDETPKTEVQGPSVEREREGRMMWSQSDFDMTGCLRSAVEEEEDTKPKPGGAEKNTDLDEVLKQESTDMQLPSGAGKAIQESDMTESEKLDMVVAQLPTERVNMAEVAATSEAVGRVEEHMKEERAETAPQPSLLELKQATPSHDLTDLTVETLESPESISKSESSKKIVLEEAQVKEVNIEEDLTLSREEEAQTSQSPEQDLRSSTEVPPVEVITDSEQDIQAVVTVEEKVLTEVQIDLKEAELEDKKFEGSPDSVKEEVFSAERERELGVEALSLSRSGGEDEIMKQEQIAQVAGSSHQEQESDHLLIFVPKGKTVEMDVDMETGLQTADESFEDLSPSVKTPSSPEVVEETPEMMEAELHIEKLERVSPAEEAKEQIMDEDEEAYSPLSALRSFAPQEDLSISICKDGQTTEDASIIEALTEQQEKEEAEVAGEEYEMIPTDAEVKRGEEELVPGWEAKELQMEDEQDALELLEEEPIEAGYDIIDAEEEHQARLAAELQGLDWFCLTCEHLLSEEEQWEHRGHKVTTVDKAFEELKDRLSEWISELQGRSENIEDLVSELELAYNSVEDQFVESESATKAQNEEMMALVMEQYNAMSVNMEEEKKTKLERLYDQIVSFQENIDSARSTLETTAREAETEARSPEEIHERLQAALESTMSVELGPRGLLVFEDYAKGNSGSSHRAQRERISVPHSPALQAQEPGSATSTNVTVYWKVNADDIIDCFQVYCMEEPQGAVSEEYRVTVKESHCVLEELEPDKTYKVWVMAVNCTGCSLPSERLHFSTAPSVPVIHSECCTVMWDVAMLRWSPGKQVPGLSYTLEYCRQYELEGEGLRSTAGIESCEHRVVLLPNESYLFYIKAVNEAGASEQSEAALISTKGTRFQLLKSSAHPALELSSDQTTLCYTQEAHEQRSPKDKLCPSILGELLPASGRCYWETAVGGCAAYRLGVAYRTAHKSSSLGENSLSWCLRCTPTPSGCRFQLLHVDVRCSVQVIEAPERVGTLLDYQSGRLAFYDATSGQLLGSFQHSFTKLCHPAFALESPGRLQVRMVPEVPAFIGDS